MIKNIKITSGIIIMMIVSVIFTFSIGGLAYLNMKNINNNIAIMYTNKVVPLAAIGSVRADFLNIQMYINRAISENNTGYDTNVEDYKGRIEKRLKEYTIINMDESEKAQIDKFKNSYSKYVSNWNNIKNKLNQEQPVSNEEIKSFSDLGIDIEASLKALKDYDLEVANKLKSSSDNVYHNSLKIFLSVFMLGLVIQVIISYLIIKSIRKSSKEMMNTLNIVSEGDFTVIVEGDTSTEFGIMKNSLSKTIQSISDMIKTVKANSENINQASNGLSLTTQEISSASENVTHAIQDVAQGTSSQAEDLTNINSIINEFSMELGKIVKSTKDVDSNSKEMYSVANQSGLNMKAVVESAYKVKNTFEELISKISVVGNDVNQISEIINLINNISEQTNLLALNAAIESARAGEAGRGFAVVADEIRKLAEQSKNSAEEISVLIENISNNTNEMIKTNDVMKDELINQGNDIRISIDSFEKIVECLDIITPKIQSVSNSVDIIDNKKNDILEKIENASAVAQEVAASSEQIAASSQEVDASTQEINSTVHDLNNMTKEMIEQVNKFKL